MDTVSHVSRPAHVVRPAALLLVLAFVVLALIVLLGPSLGGALEPDTDEPLLGPFRWTSARGLA